MDGYERIRNFSEWLELIGMPAARVGKLEAELTNAYSRIMREQRAAALMGEIGAVLAAERLKCHRVTVYRRAKKLHSLHSVQQSGV